MRKEKNSLIQEQADCHNIGDSVNEALCHFISKQHAYRHFAFVQGGCREVLCMSLFLNV